MTRFRLQLPGQQIELLPGETRIGRSPTCAVTIEDPLISREHGLIRISDNVATYEDLASRNGSRINGKLVYLPIELHHGDIIAIGRHELRFIVVTDAIAPPPNRSTGVMRKCSRCDLPYSADRGACPHCASADYIEEGPATEKGAGHAWALEMLIELLERAISLGRTDDARRVIRRGAELLEELRASGRGVDPMALDCFLERAEQAADEAELVALRALAKAVASREEGEG